MTDAATEDGLRSLIGPSTDLDLLELTPSPHNDTSGLTLEQREKVWSTVCPQLFALN